MRRICVFNIKGGVAKTTTAISLAAGISRHDKKVLLIDLDPQGNVDASLKVNAEYDLYDALTGKLEIQQCIVNLATNFDVITSKDTLLKMDHYLARQEKDKLMLKEALDRINSYDFIIVDCPPSLGMITHNALAFADELFVPVSTDYLGYNAIKKMQGIVNSINDTYDHELKITKIIPTMFDRRNKICKEMLFAMQQEYPELTAYPIRYNTKLKEAPMHGKSIFTYAKSSPGAEDYGKLVEDVLTMKISATVRA
jgi:chromosome partitioning protein